MGRLMREGWTPPLTIGWPDDPFPKTMRRDWEDFFQKKHPDVLKQVNLAHAHDINSVLVSDLFKTDLAPLQYKHELAHMLMRAASISPKTIMEIGCDRCSGFYHWCLLPTVQKIIGCEIRGTPFSDLFEKNFPDIDFCWVEDSRSADTLIKIETFLGNQDIDVLFIDGDKCFYTEDFETYLPVMSPNGIVFMHDVTEGYPREVFEKMVAKGYRGAIIRDTSAYDEFSMRDGPPTNSYEHWLAYWKGTSCGVGVLYMEGEK